MEVSSWRRDGDRWAINPQVHTLFAKAAEAEKAQREAVRELIRLSVQEL